jgi:small-conductance mechanosensitive channel
MSFQDVMREISQFLGTPLYTIGGTQGTVGTALTVAFMILVTWWLSLLLSKAILRAFKRRGAVDQNAVRPYARAAQLFVLIVGLGVALNTLGFKLTAVFAAGGLFAVALGFAMKNIAENFVSGLNEAIWWSLKDAGIVIAFPQVDVHFDEPVVESLKGLHRAR